MERVSTLRELFGSIQHHVFRPQEATKSCQPRINDESVWLSSGGKKCGGHCQTIQPESLFDGSRRRLAGNHDELSECSETRGGWAVYAHSS